MKLLYLILLFVLNPANAKTVIWVPPEGFIHISEFTPKTPVDKNAYEATLLYLKSKVEDTNHYYITKSGLDVTSGIYKFTLKHASSFHDNNKLIINKSYKNGTVHYDVLSNKVVNFVR